MSYTVGTSSSHKPEMKSMSLRWDAPNVKFVTLGGHIFWLFSALLFHAVCNLPCHSKVFVSNVGPPSYRELYRISVFYLTICPPVCQFDIFLRNCSLVFSSESLTKFTKFWELHPPLPFRFQSINKMLTENEQTNDF